MHDVKLLAVHVQEVRYNWRRRMILEIEKAEWQTAKCERQRQMQRKMPHWKPAYVYPVVHFLTRHQTAIAATPEQLDVVGVRCIHSHRVTFALESLAGFLHVPFRPRSEEHTSELQSRPHLV